MMNTMNMSEAARLILGLRAAGWNEEGWEYAH